MLVAVFPYHIGILLGRDFSRKGHNKSSGKLGVPLLLNCFNGVPECATVSIFGRSVWRQHDFRVNDATLLCVAFSFLVILGKQAFAALIGSSGNG